MSKPLARYHGQPYLFGKKPNEEETLQEKRRAVLQTQRREQEQEQYNKRRRQAVKLGRKIPLSPAQRQCGARRLA